MATMGIKTMFGVDINARTTLDGDVWLIFSIDDDYSVFTLSKDAALALSALLATTATEGGDE